MPEPSELRTSPSLLRRVAAGDAEAQHLFDERYRPAMRDWLRVRGIQEADRDDIIQNVIVQIIANNKVAKFNREKASFRTFLKMITWNAVSDYFKRHARPGRGSGDSFVNDQLTSVEAREDLWCRLNSVFDTEILEEAMERVKQRVEERTWEYFMRMVHGEPAEDIANALEGKPGAVHGANHRVRNMIKKQIELLETGE